MPSKRTNRIEAISKALDGWNQEDRVQKSAPMMLAALLAYEDALSLCGAGSGFEKEIEAAQGKFDVLRREALRMVDIERVSRGTDERICAQHALMLPALGNIQALAKETLALGKRRGNFVEVFRDAVETIERTARIALEGVALIARETTKNKGGNDAR